MAVEDPISGSFNGLTFGPGGSVAVADSEGIDDMPELRTADQDVPGEGMIAGDDYPRRRVCTFSWLLIADTPALLPALRTVVQRACRPQVSSELPLLINNSNRELRCRPRVLNIPRQHDAAQRTAEAVVRFDASDPWWYDASDSSEDFATGTLATFFPIFPLRLSSSEVFAVATVDNDGDTDAWPVWTITGPGSAIVLRNLTSGLLLSIAATLDVGETVTVDTRRGAKTIVKNDGTNLFSSSTGDLWPLVEGSNSVQIEMGSATSSSLVNVRWRRRWMAGV